MSDAIVPAWNGHMQRGVIEAMSPSSSTRVQSCRSRIQPLNLAISARSARPVGSPVAWQTEQTNPRLPNWQPTVDYLRAEIARTNPMTSPCRAGGKVSAPKSGAQKAKIAKRTQANEPIGAAPASEVATASNLQNEPNLTQHRSGAREIPCIHSRRNRRMSGVRGLGHTAIGSRRVEGLA
jgi:hypothetical protein